MKHAAVFIALLLACLPAGSSVAFAQGSDPAKQILQLTGGARTKIVWKRQSPTRIMILDTNVGVEKVVTTVENGGSGVTGQDVVTEPFITATGTRVVFVENSKLYVVDTSGQNKRELCPARCAMGVAEDPPGTEWAYYGDMDHVQDSNNPNAPGKLWRVQIDNPKVQEMVWGKTSICWQWAFTRDGKTAAGALPWPGAHIANLPNGSYQQIHDSGCMVGIAPSGKRMFHSTALQFGGEHRGIGVHSAPWPGQCALINLGDAPGVNNGTMLFPAWALYDDRFFVVSGPWTGPSGTTRVLFGQFNAEFNGIANWVQVTQPPAGTQDVYPSCWIQSGPIRSGPKVKDSPVAGLDLKLLASFVKRLDAAL